MAPATGDDLASDLMVRLLLVRLAVATRNRNMIQTLNLDSSPMVRWAASRRGDEIDSIRPVQAHNGALLESTRWERARKLKLDMPFQGPRGNDVSAFNGENPQGSSPNKDYAPACVTAKRTPPILPATIDDARVNAVSARDLHRFQEVGKVFGAWITDRIEAYGFQDYKDFEVIEGLSVPNPESSKARAQKTKEAHAYFIEC